MTIEWSASRDRIVELSDWYRRKAIEWEVPEWVEAHSWITKLRVKDAKAEYAYGFMNIDKPQIPFREEMEIWVPGRAEHYEGLIGVEIVREERWVSPAETHRARH